MSESAWQTSISPGGEHLVLYDGVFGLCNRLNNFVLARDTRAVFDFASLQSTVGRSTLARFGRKRSEEHTSELQSRLHLVCRLLLEKKKQTHYTSIHHTEIPSSAPTS